MPDGRRRWVLVRGPERSGWVIIAGVFIVLASMILTQIRENGRAGVKHMSKMFRKAFVPSMVTAVCLWSLALAAGEQQLRFADAWVRAVPPGMGMTAGFGTIRNEGPDDIELTAFSSPEFGEVSLHRTEEVDGVSRMRDVPSLTVPSGAAVELAPGGYHLMLMKPLHKLEAGQPATLRMTAEDGRVFTFEVPVERR